MGALPIRDMRATPHHTKQRTSPPTLRLRASRSVMSPWLVDRTATPRPPRTRGTSSPLRVHPQARLGHATQAGDHRAALGRVLHRDGQHLAGPVGGRRPRRSRRCSPPSGAAAASASFCLERRHAHLVVHRRVGVADAGEHVGDGIGHHRVGRLLTSSPWSRPGISPGVRQLAQAAPGTGRTCGTRTRGTAAAAGSACSARTLNFGLLAAACSASSQPCLVLVRPCDAWSAAPGFALVNGKPKASSRALPSALVRAVVTMVMSMPRVESTLS